jgi:hypothetical protein
LSSCITGGFARRAQLREIIWTFLLACKCRTRFLYLRFVIKTHPVWRRMVVMRDECWTGKDLKWSGLGLIPGICLERLRNTTENLSGKVVSRSRFEPNTSL